MDNSKENLQSAIVRFSDFPKYFALPIIKSIMDITINETKKTLQFLELASTTDVLYKEGTIRLELCTHFAFSCHIYLNDYSDEDLYEFIELKLSYLFSSFKYLEMYCICSGSIYEHTYRAKNYNKEVWKQWKENNLFKNVKYISLAFELPKAEGQTLCNLVIFRS